MSAYTDCIAAIDAATSNAAIDEAVATFATTVSDVLNNQFYNTARCHGEVKKFKLMTAGSDDHHSAK